MQPPPLQITFRHMAPSPALEARIRRLAARLEKFSQRMVRCHIVVEPPPPDRHRGGMHELRIDITLPDAQIAVHHAHEDPYLAMRDAFRAARRKLEEHERKARLDIKTHLGPAHERS